MLFVHTRCRELRHLLIAEVIDGEFGSHRSRLRAVYRLEGEVAYQSGIGRVEALMAAVGNVLALQCRIPDAHVVNATGKATTHIEVRACQCRYARFGQCLHSRSVHVGDG